ncbi:MAG: YncE family protein, partial [Myxococcota bacterium]
MAKFRVTRHGKLRFQGDLPVGLEPVSLAVRPGSEDVWVVNHLSDSVSVVDGHTMTLLATLQVGDEPTDVAFASGRAFVSLAGKEDRVVVYDALSLERITSLEIFGDDPRALAVSPDGTRVALVVLESGNGTTTVHQSQFTPERQPPIPFPARDPIFPPDFGELLAPSEPLIVRFDPERELFTDESGADWSDKVFFGLEAQLPDHDLFWIDATSNPPFVTNTTSRVGTTLFDVDIHPKTGEAWVSNTDARNEVRFEPVLRGHLVETRISRVDPVWGSVNHVDLNPHIDRSVTPGPPEEIATSLSAPGDGVFSRSGHRYYLTAFGSAKIAILNGRSGKVLQRIEVGGGPSGLALHPRNKRLYVMQRFSNTIGIVNLKRGKKIGEIGVSGPRAFDPTPSTIRQGRRFLYDAQLSSGHGDISCATCHIFGNFDGLAWDLGDPQGEFVLFEDAPWLSDLATPHAGMDPMKGPMVTQSLRGLLETEPFHWRGDRENFQHFNGAFVSLLGRDTLLSGADMDSFTQFAVNIDYPPNPYRQLDDSLPESIPGHGDA